MITMVDKKEPADSGRLFFIYPRCFANFEEEGGAGELVVIALTTSPVFCLSHFL